MPADFLDSNVLVYALDPSDPVKHERAKLLVGSGISTQSAAVSYQVVQEVLNVCTKRLAASFDAPHRNDLLRAVLLPLCKLHSSPQLYEQALAIQDAHSFSFYDALIVASAHALGCKRLLSEDMQHGRVIDGVRIENPFAA
jgi:predicted nucleic acid-binding protein